ncbi:MAG: hypothetical protein PUE13_08505 [Clostridiales bacterium]|nr:hypothetical protein [Clostridiales bacterium]
MKSTYIYLQLYRLFDRSTPLLADCGGLCGSACCEGDESGMYLFPGEESVYKLLNPDWGKIEYSDFEYEYNGKTKKVPILFCNGCCDRYQRPLACRIFPLTPYVKDGQFEIIIDPRAKSVCPLASELTINQFDEKFVNNIKKSFILLMKNAEIKEYMNKYSEYIDEYRRFFKE